MSEFYKFHPKDSEGNDFDFEQLRNKVVLIVNVASKCGLVQQYAELEELYEKYKQDGFVVLAFPCNQFGGQEPGSEKEIVAFCRNRFHVSFEIMRKINVNGFQQDPLYAWLKDQKPGRMGFKGIKWNFEKFLVDRNGTVAHRWESITTPLTIESHIKALLDEKSCHIFA